MKLKNPRHSAEGTRGEWRHNMFILWGGFVEEVRFKPAVKDWKVVMLKVVKNKKLSATA